MKKNTQLIETLRDLRNWADLETKVSGENRELRKAWCHVRDWAEGTAQKYGIEAHEIQKTPD